MRLTLHHFIYVLFAPRLDHKIFLSAFSNKVLNLNIKFVHSTPSARLTYIFLLNITLERGMVITLLLHKVKLWNSSMVMDVHSMAMVIIFKENRKSISLVVDLQKSHQYLNQSIVITSLRWLLIAMMILTELPYPIWCLNGLIITRGGKHFQPLL